MSWVSPGDEQQEQHSQELDIISEILFKYLQNSHLKNYVLEINLKDV